MERQAAPIVGIIQLEHAGGIEPPRYHSDLAAGMDLRAAVRDSLLLEPRQRELVPTGLVLELPAGFEGQVRPRSGLALKHGITCLNSPGTIDADYRGEVGVLLVNLGSEPFVVERGMRIAQLIIAPVAQAITEIRTKVSATERGESGFGSTGSG